LESEQLAERALTAYLNSVRTHYNEELLWSEKGRRLSNYWTSALILLNSMLFGLSITLFEPRKRQAVAERVANDTKAIFRDEIGQLESKLVALGRGSASDKHVAQKRIQNQIQEKHQDMTDVEIDDRVSIENSLSIANLQNVDLETAASAVLHWLPLVTVSALVTFSALSK
jgi:hypothetical protein